MVKFKNPLNINYFYVVTMISIFVLIFGGCQKDDVNGLEVSIANHLEFQSLSSDLKEELVTQDKDLQVAAERGEALLESRSPDLRDSLLGLFVRKFRSETTLRRFLRDVGHPQWKYFLAYSETMTDIGVIVPVTKDGEWVASLLQFDNDEEFGDNDIDYVTREHMADPARHLHDREDPVRGEEANRLYIYTLMHASMQYALEGRIDSGYYHMIDEYWRLKSSDELDDLNPRCVSERYCVRSRPGDGNPGPPGPMVFRIPDSERRPFTASRKTDGLLSRGSMTCFIIYTCHEPPEWEDDWGTDPRPGGGGGGGGSAPPRPRKLSDSDVRRYIRSDVEPVIELAGDIHDFTRTLYNTKNQAGHLRGQEAADYLRKLGETEYNGTYYSPVPTRTNEFNEFKGRYLYSCKGGWIDMRHFMFYAGRAYDYKLREVSDPIGKAVRDGKLQEALDSNFSPRSAYSYEDLPSDLYGATFAVDHFDPTNTKLSFAAQIYLYLVDELKVQTPQDAPNYRNVPSNNSDIGPLLSVQNRTTNPKYTKSGC